ncbi:PD-(D/E)XK nuclease family protein [Brevibacterium casei]|uniref:Uncharacterized protein n=3 Tax=Brevibacterium casei TaxID=33889 RepID=K9B0A6_9MICO|nr:PD-(D/E)XK nuclease family protein [Brevibacterium casei]EKU47230.1 hypothetical protein C272_08372 [Brevibacterium casei S18]
MDQSDAPSPAQQNLEIARMFTSAIGTAFTSDRVIERNDGSMSVGHQKQEATAQALLDYILNQDDEAAAFGRALKLPKAGRLDVGKEVTLSDGRRVDHSLSVGDEYVAFIEDKLWASFGVEQLYDYVQELQSWNADGQLIVIVPGRRRDEAQREIDRSAIGIHTRIIAWVDLPTLMKGKSKKLYLWEALSRFATEVGSSNLLTMSAKGSFPQLRDVAESISQYLDSAAEIAATYLEERAAAENGVSRLREFKFSTHRGNDRAWLQAGATQREKWGLDIEPGYNGQSSIWLYHQSARSDLSMQIGYFKHGLSAAARERIRQVARKGVNENRVLDLRGLNTHRLGTFLTPSAQDALKVLMQVFDIRTAENYLPKETTFRGVNDGPSRHGMKFVLDNREVEAFMGPPVGKPWIRPSIFIRDDDGEREVRPLKRDSGKQYVERVWAEISARLTT